jgi:tetratricopeptide (TPR) repeat protein
MLNDRATRLQEKLQTLSGKARVDALNDLCYELRGKDLRTIELYCREALALAEKEHYEQGEAESLTISAYLYFHKANFEQAIRDALTAQQRFQKVGLLDTKFHADVLNTLGLVYRNIGDYEASLQSLYKSLSIRGQLKDKGAEAAALTNIGNVYVDVKNYENALSYYRESLRLRESEKNDGSKAAALLNIGTVLALQQHYDEGETYIKEALSIHQQLGNRFGEIRPLNNLGELYAKKGDTAGAMQCFERSLSLAREVGDKRMEIMTLINLSEIYRSENNLARAKEHLSSALVLAETIKAVSILPEVYQLMAKTSADEKNFDAAYHHQLRYEELKSAMNLEETTVRVKNMETRLAIQKAEQERDIYLSKNAELTDTNAALQSASSLKTQLLGIAANELKVPLESIIKFSDALSAGDMIKPEGKQYAMLIHDLSTKMKNIVSSLLNTEVIRNGKLNLQLRPIAFCQLLDLSLMNRQDKFDAKSIAVEQDLAGDCRVMSDEARLKEIIDTLLDAALNEMPEHQTLQLFVKQSLSIESQPTVEFLLVYPSERVMSDNDIIALKAEQKRRAESLKELAALIGGSMRSRFSIREGNRIQLEFPAAV